MAKSTVLRFLTTSIFSMESYRGNLYRELACYWVDYNMSVASVAPVLQLLGRGVGYEVDIPIIRTKVDSYVLYSEPPNNRSLRSIIPH